MGEMRFPGCRSDLELRAFIPRHETFELPRALCSDGSPRSDLPLTILFSGCRASLHAKPFCLIAGSSSAADYLFRALPHR